MISAYLDESGTHDNSPIVVVAAYIGKPTAWATWTEQWNSTKGSVKVFHAADLHNRDGEFEGWTETQRNEFVIKMLAILEAAPFWGIAAGINMDEFKKHLKGRNDLLEIFPTPYAACLQWVLSHIIKLTNEHHGHEEIVFVHEQNDYRSQALETFDYINLYCNPTNRQLSIAFDDKSLAPLQAADILAYESNRQLRSPTSPPSKPWLAIDPRQSKIDLMHFGKDNMHALVRKLEFIRKAYDAGSPVDFSALFSQHVSGEPVS